MYTCKTSTSTILHLRQNSLPSQLENVTMGQTRIRTKAPIQDQLLAGLKKLKNDCANVARFLTTGESDISSEAFLLEPASWFANSGSGSLKPFPPLFKNGGAVAMLSLLTLSTFSLTPPLISTISLRFVSMVAAMASAFTATHVCFCHKCTSLTYVNTEKQTLTVCHKIGGEHADTPQHRRLSSSQLYHTLLT